MGRHSTPETPESRPEKVKPTPEQVSEKFEADKVQLYKDVEKTMGKVKEISDKYGVNCDKIIKQLEELRNEPVDSRGVLDEMIGENDSVNFGRPFGSFISIVGSLIRGENFPAGISPFSEEDIKSLVSGLDISEAEWGLGQLKWSIKNADKIKNDNVREFAFDDLGTKGMFESTLTEDGKQHPYKDSVYYLSQIDDFISGEPSLEEVFLAEKAKYPESSVKDIYKAVKLKSVIGQVEAE